MKLTVSKIAVMSKISISSQVPADLNSDMIQEVSYINDHGSSLSYGENLHNDVKFRVFVQIKTYKA